MRLLPLVTLFSLCGCSFLSGSDLPDNLVDAQRLWHDGGVVTYDMLLERSCFCTPESLGPFGVRVENGRVAFAVADGQTVPTDRVLSIEDLFDLLETAYREEAHLVAVEYDPVFGFPSEVYIDYDENMSNEEIGYTVAYVIPD